MAIRLQQAKRLNVIEIVSEIDDAIDMNLSEWEEYKKTGDRKFVMCKPGKQPTIFLCNFELKGKESAHVKNAMLDGKDEDGAPKVTIGSWSHRVVKYTLKDIVNPSDLPEEEKIVFKKDDRGYCHDDVISKLEELGIVSEIFGLYMTLVIGSHRQASKN
jgi:hypothetical protein